MGAELLALGLLLPVLLPACLTGYCACSHGRSFWLWFALGVMAPGLSLGLLIGLLRRKELHPGEQAVAAAKRILLGSQAQQAALLHEARMILREAETRQLLRPTSTK